jgi:retron-type reverse transcriptase
VIRDINSTIYRQPIGWVVEADIKGYFDNIDHSWLMKFLEHDIQDKNFLRYIVRFLKAGIMDDGQYLDSESGSPQGGLCRELHKPPYAEQVIMPRTVATSAEKASVSRHNTIRQN